MKKRTLVCFLIFTLCVFYTAIPNTVFGQEDAISLAKKVFDNPESKATLLDEDVRVLLPQLLAGLTTSPLPVPTLITTALNMINTGQEATLKALAASQGITLTDDHITLLKREDVQTLLGHKDTVALLSLQGTELEAGLTEIVRLVDEAVAGDDEEETPTPGEEETPTPDPGEEETPTPDPGEEETPTPDPGEEETPTPDPTPDPGEEETPTPDEEKPPKPDGEIHPPADPFESVPTNLKSKLGGLSLNPISGRLFLNQLATTLAPDLPPELVEQNQELIVDIILDMVPQGFLPEKQIRQLLLSGPFTPFAQEADHLDFENFGNAIMPNIADFAYSELSRKKYLTSDSLHLYTRVPAKVAGVEFGLSDGTTVPGTPVTLDEFQADTVPYTFRLEETLAATNLPAWPGLDNVQLFSKVEIRYIIKGPHSLDRTANGDYISDDMTARDTGNGVVWEKELGIPSDSNVYYYFAVTLAEPVLFSTLDRVAIAELVELNPTTITLDDVFSEENQHKIRIDGWAMPDPRNLQLADRGIIKQLLTGLDLGFEHLSLLSAVTGGQNLSPAQQRELGRIQRQFIANTNALTTHFENEFDPLLASVFSIPSVDFENDSLWVAHIPITTDGNYQVKADVLDTDGTVLQRIQENIQVDTTAPEGGINIELGENVTGYQRGNVLTATAPIAGTAATLNISGTATDVAPGEGYLFYQMIGLNEDGTPYLEKPGEEPLIHRPNTWMPLTVENTMLASNIWDAISEAVAKGRLDAPSDPIVQTALGLPLSAILGPGGILDPANPASAGLIKQFADPFLGNLEFITGVSELNLNQYQLILEALDATVDIINHLVPVTFREGAHVVMPIQYQDAQMPLVGDYGIRALGIDTLFNVGAYAVPTHLRIVEPVTDQAKVTAVSIGDRNGDGIVGNRWWESGHIFANTTEGVMLTVENVPNPKGHLINHANASILVQYQDANGAWQDIGNANLSGLDDPDSAWKVEVPWNVTDFDALVAAGNTVTVRAVATNALTLEDQNPMTFEITLDNDVHPVDPEVLALAVDKTTITQTNPDSGAPQGTFTIDAYTPQRTSIESLAMDPMTDGIASLRLEIKGGEYADWTDLGLPSAKGERVNDAKATDLVEVGMQEKVASDTYQYWSFTVDTTELADTITKDTLEVAHALATGAIDENMYSVRAIAVLADGSDDTEDPAGQPMDSFSVDNDDDVGPLGPTNLVVSGVDAVDAVFTDNGDGTYTVGGLVDIYDDAVNAPTVTFTITPTAEPKTYENGKVVLKVDETAIADGVKISESVTPNASGGFTVTVTVEIPEDTDELEATSGPYTFHALVIDEFENVQAHNLEEGALVDTNEMPSIDVTVTNTYRPNPGILAITVDDAAETNPDSGAPRGTVVLNGYTHEITSPPTESVRFEVSNDGGSNWIDVGTTEVVETLTEEATPALLDDLVQAAVAGNPEVPIVRQKWSLEVDTAALLADTISAEEDLEQAHGLKADDNPYMVRAVAITPKRPDDAETVSEDGVNKTSFSVDNIDDVGPLGPTHITMVSDIAGEVAANGDGSYTVGGIVAVADEPRALQENIATFTIDPSARPITYAGGKAKLVRMNPDGTMTEDESTTTFVGDADDEVVTITINVDELANGTYTFHALAIDAVPNVQTHNLEGGALIDTNGMPSITVHVVNFRVSDISELAVIAVDGTDVATPPMQPIPLRESLKVNFNVIASAAEGPKYMYTLNLDELTGASDHTTQQVVPSEAAENPEKTFSLMVNLDVLQTDGRYTPHGVVTRSNGWVGFPLAEAGVNLDRTPPSITIEVPSEGHTVTNLPTVRATYDDGDVDLTAGVEFGGNYYPWAMPVSPDAPNMFVSLKRLKPHLGANDVPQSEVDTAVETLVYTRKEELTGGAYQFDVTVIDRLGNSDTQSVAFAVDGVEPTVLIHEPASGTTFNHRRPTVSGFFAGVEVTITKATFDGEEVTLNQTGEQFAYTHPEALTDGEHTLTVEVTDEDGRTDEASVTFAVAATAPVISAVAPTGKVEGMAENNPVMLSAVVTDDQSAVTSVTFSVNGGEAIAVPMDQLSDGRVEVDAGMLASGAYTVTLTAMSEGGTTEHQWMFEIVQDTTPPVISAAAPTGKVEGMAENNPIMLSAVVTDDQSAVSSVTLSVDDGEAIAVPMDQLSDGRVEVDAGMFASGAYTVTLTAMSEGGTTEHQWMFEIVQDTTPPVISAAAPTGKVEGMAENNPIMLSAVVTDDQSAVSSVTLSVDDGEAIAVPMDQLSDGRVEVDAGMLASGAYTVTLTAMSEGGTTEHQWMFEIVQDTTPPVISAAAPTGKVEGMAENNPIMLSAVVTDDQSAVSSVTLSVDDGEAIAVPMDQLSDGRVEVDAGMFASGAYTVTLTAMSEGGTTEHQWMFEIVQDTTPPVISAAAPTGKVEGMAENNPIMLSAVVTDDQSAVSSVTLSVDDGEAIAVPMDQLSDGRVEVDAGMFASGAYTVTLTAMSEGGTTEHQWMFEIVQDTTPPVISAAAPTGKVEGMAENNPIMLSAVVTDDQSAVSSVTLSVDDGEAIAVPMDQLSDGRVEVDAGMFASGAYTVTLTAMSEGGTTEHQWMFEIVQDTTPPVISAAAPTGKVEGMAENNPVMLSAVVTDDQSAVSSVTLSVDDGEAIAVPMDQLSDGRVEVDAGKFKSGAYTVTLTAMSEGGTTEHQWMFEIVQDTTPPVISAAAPTGKVEGMAENNPIMLSAVVTDDQSAVSSVTLSVGDGEAIAVPMDQLSDGRVEVDAGMFASGAYTVTLTAMSEGGTTEHQWMFEIVQDTTPPVISAAAPTGKVEGMAENNPVMLSAVVTDDQSAVSSVTLSVDDGEAIAVPMDQLSDGRVEVDAGMFASGAYTVTLTAMSEGGTTEHQWMFEIVQDTTPPVISAAAPTGKVEGMAENNPIMLSAVVTDDQSAVSSVTLSVDDGEAIAVPMDQLSDGRVEVDAGMLASGAYTVTLTAMSEGGTTEHQWMFEIVQDTTPPVISAAAPTGKVEGMAENNPIMLSAVVTDDQSAVSSVTLSVDDGEAIAVPMDQLSDGRVEVDAGMFASGAYTVTLTAMSEGGTTEHQWMFEIVQDTTPPVISAAAPTGKVEGMAENNPIMLSAVVTDDQSAVSSVTLSVDDGEAIAVPMDQLSDGRVEVDAGMFASGAYTVTLTAMSEGGTTEHQWMFEIVQDTTPPVISAAAPTGKVEGMAENNPIMLSAVVTDDQSAVSSVTLSVDDGEAIAVPMDQLSDGRVEVDAGMLASGAYTVTLTAMSEGGTTEHQWMFEIVQDTTPPVISAAAPTGKVEGMAENNPIMLSAVVTDDQSAVSSVTLSVDDGEAIAVPMDQLSDGRVEVDAGMFASGAYTVTLTAMSEGGTTEHQWMFEIVQDTTPPVISEVAPEGLVNGTSDDRMVTISAVVTDEQSPIESIQFMLDGELIEAGTSDAELIDNLNGAVADNGDSIAEHLNDVLETVTHSAMVELDEPRSYNVEVIATSEGGSAKHTWTFTFVRDTTPPVISSVAPIGKIAGANGDNSVTLSAVVTDNESAVTSVSISVDDGDPEVITDSAVLGDGRIEVAGVFQEGAHTVTVVAESDGGTTEHQWMFEIVPDTTPPVISSVAPTGKIAGSKGSNAVTLSAVVTDNESVVTSVSISVDDGDPEVITDSAVLGDGRIEVAGVFQEGAHTVTVVAESDGGTTEHQWMFEIVPDTTPPVISSVAPTGKIAGSKGSNAVTLSAVVTDNESVVTSVSISVDDGDPEVITDSAVLGDGRIEVAGVFQEGAHTVTVVAESDGGTTEHQWMFEIVPDTTPPVISSVAPTGLIESTNREALGQTRVSAVVTDEQSAISDVEFTVNGVKLPVSRTQIAAGAIEAPVDLTQGPGLYTVRIKATSEGGTTEHVWTFTFAIDNVAPTISSITPNGTIRTETPTISVSATDESGISEIRIAVFNGQNQQLKGSVENDVPDEGKAGGITRADFIPENPLTEGTYLIIVDASDILGNTATARGSFTIDFDTAAPIITMSAPHESARFVLKRGEEAPTVSVTYADAESGIDVESITMVIEGVDSDYRSTPNGTKITFTDQQKSASQAIHPLLVDTKAEPETWVGKYTVRFEVSDKAHLAGYVSDDNKGTREANWTVHTFSFFLEAAEVPLLAEQVFNYPNPFKDDTTIRFTLTRKAKVNIVIYDATLRPVRVLVDGIAEPGKKEIEWDGTSSAGVDLARGIYFCQIIVADDIEPEYAILKLALTR